MDLWASAVGVTVKQVAAVLGVTEVTLSTWLRAAGVALGGRTLKDPAQGAPGPVAPAQELARLRWQNADLRAARDLAWTERDILPRAERYFYFAGQVRW